MSDTDGKKPLGLGGAPRSGSVKQSFSHGRTHAVVVETKRKRVVAPPKPGNTPIKTPSRMPTNIRPILTGDNATANPWNSACTSSMVSIPERPRSAL